MFLLMYGFHLLFGTVFCSYIYQIRSMIVTASGFGKYFVHWKATKIGRCWRQKVLPMFHVILSCFWCSEKVLLLKGILIGETTSKETTWTVPFLSKVMKILQFWKFVTKLICGVKHPLFSTYSLEREWVSMYVCVYSKIIFCKIE